MGGKYKIIDQLFASYDLKYDNINKFSKLEKYLLELYYSKYSNFNIFSDLDDFFPLNNSEISSKYSKADIIIFNQIRNIMLNQIKTDRLKKIRHILLKKQKFLVKINNELVKKATKNWGDPDNYLNYKAKYKSEFLYKNTNNRQQWDNSIYLYNSKKLISISQQKNIITTFLNGYFNLYSQKIESKANIIQTWSKYRKRFSNKIFFNLQSEKQTNKDVTLTLLVYNRSDKYIINLFKKNKLDILFKIRHLYYNNISKKTNFLKNKNKFLKYKNSIKNKKLNFSLLKNKNLYNGILYKKNKKKHLFLSNKLNYQQDVRNYINYILSKINKKSMAFDKTVVKKISLKNLYYKKTNKKLKNKKTIIYKFSNAIYTTKIRKKSKKVTYVLKAVNIKNLYYLGIKKKTFFKYKDLINNKKKLNLKKKIKVNKRLHKFLLFKNLNYNKRTYKLLKINKKNKNIKTKIIKLFKWNKKLNTNNINENIIIDTKNISIILTKILTILKNKNLMQLSNLLKIAFNIIQENQETKHKKREKLMIYYKHIIQLNKFKFENVFLSKLKNILSGIYNKNINFNIINLKYPKLDSSIYTEIINMKAKTRKFSIRTILNKALSIPVKKLRKFEYIKDRQIYELIKNTDKVKKVSNIYILPEQKEVKNYLTNYTDFLNNKLEQTFACYKKDNEIGKHVIGNLKNKYIKGIKIEAKGRLTKRLIASRSIFKYGQKGSIRNYTSSYLGQYGYLLRNQVDSNVQYTKLISKNRNGAFGLKGWISSV